ncbi:MAG TPA: hypothetical protein VHM20_01915 [Gammaproteobacteria bacterium]|jgi:hypothetical protein|nr:hypothetical protein [Gammaproteobacteria bacterium]
MSKVLRFNKFLPIAIIYFFFNSFLLPHGLLYTTLLTPFFFLWLYKKEIFPAISYFFLFSLPFLVIHFVSGVEILPYIKSYLLLFSVFIFCMAFFQFLKECQTLTLIYKDILIINIFFVFIAIIALFIPFLKNSFWYSNAITSGIQKIDRLKMLTYEPSYYSILFVPIALYYFLKMLFFRSNNTLLNIIFIALPMILSLSFGILLGLAITVILLFLSDINLFTYKRKFPALIIGLFVLGLVAFLILLQFFPDNVFFLRVSNVFSGKDTSFNGRTFDSFFLGWKIAAKKSVLFGAGLGQVKSLGLDLFKDFYNYTNFTEEEIGIPNSLGDTLAIFGVSGVLLRLSIEILFFFKTKVYSNYLRLSLFIFAFIYQFTGSFITNIAEYIIWIMAFCPWIFIEFNKSNIKDLREIAYSPD